MNGGGAKDGVVWPTDLSLFKIHWGPRPNKARIYWSEVVAFGGLEVSQPNEMGAINSQQKPKLGPPPSPLSLLSTRTPMDENVWMDAGWAEWSLFAREREPQGWENLCTFAGCFDALDAWSLLGSRNPTDEKLRMCVGCVDAWSLLGSPNPMDEKLWMDAEWVEWLGCVLPFCERQPKDEKLCTFVEMLGCLVPFGLTHPNGWLTVDVCRDAWLLGCLVPFCLTEPNGWETEDECGMSGAGGRACLWLSFLHAKVHLFPSFLVAHNTPFPRVPMAFSRRSPCSQSLTWTSPWIPRGQPQKWIVVSWSGFLLTKCIFSLNKTSITTLINKYIPL